MLRWISATYSILIEIWFSSRTACLSSLPCTQYLPPLNSLDFSTWGALMVKGNAMAQQKMCSLKQTVWQLWAAKVRQWCSRTAPRLDQARRRSWLLVAAIGLVPKLLSLHMIYEHFLGFEFKIFL
jgi:hypothetical protein